MTLLVVVGLYVLFVVARAIAERSWERIGWLVTTIVAGVVVFGIGRFAQWAEREVPFGIGTLFAFFGGASVLVLGVLVVFYGVPMTFFAGLPRLRGSTNGHAKL